MISFLLAKLSKAVSVLVVKAVLGVGRPIASIKPTVPFNAVTAVVLSLYALIVPCDAARSSFRVPSGLVALENFVMTALSPSTLALMVS